jgi:hypothetical protein
VEFDVQSSQSQIDDVNTLLKVKPCLHRSHPRSLAPRKKSYLFALLSLWPGS